MSFHLHFWRLGSTIQLFVLHVCMRRLPDSYYSGSSFCPVSLHLNPTAAMAAPSTRWEEQLRLTVRLAPLLTTTRQPSWSNYTSRSTRLHLRHYYATTLPTLNSSLRLRYLTPTHSLHPRRPTDATLQFHTAQHLTT